MGAGIAACIGGAICMGVGIPPACIGCCIGACCIGACCIAGCGIGACCIGVCGIAAVTWTGAGRSMGAGTGTGTGAGAAMGGGPERPGTEIGGFAPVRPLPAGAGIGAMGGGAATAAG